MQCSTTRRGVPKSLLNQAVIYEVLPSESRVCRVLRLFLRLLPLNQLDDVLLADYEALVLHNEQWPTASAKVSVKPKLPQPDVMHYPHLCVDVHL